MRPNVATELSTCLDFLLRRGIHATFFIPASLVHRCRLQAICRRIVADGHQLACHGLLHERPENFRDDPPDVQIGTLHQAKRILEDVAGVAVSAFRAPSFIISHHTLAALDDCGFRADLSVNSRRLSLFSSQVANLSWLTAPVDPYHPSRETAYRPGSLTIWEIPLTSLILPFVSGLYQTLGMTFAKLFAIALIRETRLTVNRPLVYMAHPEEFFPSRVLRPRTYYFGATPSLRDLSWRLVLPAKDLGFRVRWLFYERNEYTIYRRTVEMTRFLASNPELEFQTVDQFIQRLEMHSGGDNSVAYIPK